MQIVSCKYSIKRVVIDATGVWRHNVTMTRHHNVTMLCLFTIPTNQICDL